MLDFGYYHMDCIEGMKQFPDKYFDLAIVDPIYGDVKVGGYLDGTTQSGVGPKATYEQVVWKQEKTQQEYFDELFRVSKHQIIFGGNYFTEEIHKNSSCWIVWDKCNGATSWADCELAWTSFPGAVRMFSFMWCGMQQGKSIVHGKTMQGNKQLNEKRIHPNQKPIALYNWILGTFAKPGWKLLDTHTGSASSLCAFHDHGYKFVAFEKEQQYYHSSLQRYEKHTSQMSLFDMGISR